MLQREVIDLFSPWVAQPLRPAAPVAVLAVRKSPCMQGFEARMIAQCAALAVAKALELACELRRCAGVELLIQAPQYAEPHCAGCRPVDQVQLFELREPAGRVIADGGQGGRQSLRPQDAGGVDVHRFSPYGPSS